ncbi:MAG TPA: YqaJ viral recombinase family protein [Nevskiaceae bacterium]|nr:YqaJ viral recombinase family protein [Nevskiaceae bacterium]
MQLHELQQGSPEWHAFRATHHGASDASAMMAASPYKTRGDLLREVATGIRPEPDEATQRLFDRGHEAEAKARAIQEAELGEDLFPCVGSSDDTPNLSASFDGLTLDEGTAWEHKLWSEAKAAHIRDEGTIPPQDYWQCVQQLYVSGAASLLYTVSDGTAERRVSTELTRHEAEPDFQALLDGWAQFDTDVKNYKPEPQVVVPAGRAPETLPALRIDVQGTVLASNLDQWRAGALDIIRGINRDLVTDEDFANGEKTVKWLSESEAKLKAAKAAAQAQMTDVDALFRAVDDVSAEMRATRLELDKRVKAEKEHRKSELVVAAQQAVKAHYGSINTTLEPQYALGVPASTTSVLGSVIRGLKTLDSMRDKLDAAIAQAKIAASHEADRRRQCIAVIHKHTEHAHLIPDATALVCAGKDAEDIDNLITARIAQHEAAEKARLEAERARIRKEEEARTERLRQQALREVERVRAESHAEVRREECEPSVAESRMQTPEAASTRGYPGTAPIIAAIASRFGIGDSVAATWVTRAAFAIGRKEAA